jgi:hypothetical protein
MKTDDYKWLFVGAGVLALALFIFSRRSKAVQQYQPQQVNYVPVPVGGRRYINKEVVEIEWNAEYLPVKITTSRDARQYE